MTIGRTPLYDGIGHGYSRTRREDPRIAAAIWNSLGPARSVLNVGAGCGSYEPPNRLVVAVEPSSLMISQRLPGAAPVVRAVAEHLPFRDGSFDAAMGVLTIHHWTDRVRGLAEMRRVARHNVVLFIRDPDVVVSWWLYHYFPATARLNAGREFSFRELAETLGSVEAIRVPIPGDCLDGFESAYWRRPEKVLEPSVWRSMSALALIAEIDRSEGMSRLRADLASGEWDRRWGHLRQTSALDLGYRVLVARG